MAMVLYWRFRKRSRSAICSTEMVRSKPSGMSERPLERSCDLHAQHGFLETFGAAQAHADRRVLHDHAREDLTVVRDDEELLVVGRGKSPSRPASKRTTSGVRFMAAFLSRCSVARRESEVKGGPASLASGLFALKANH